MSRYSIGIAVVGSFVGATALLVYGMAETYALVLRRTPAALAGNRENPW